MTVGEICMFGGNKKELQMWMKLMLLKNLTLHCEVYNTYQYNIADKHR